MQSLQIENLSDGPTSSFYPVNNDAILIIESKQLKCTPRRVLNLEKLERGWILSNAQDSVETFEQFRNLISVDESILCMVFILFYNH